MDSATARPMTVLGLQKATHSGHFVLATALASQDLQRGGNPGTQAPKRQKVRSRGRIEANSGRSSKPPVGWNARARHGLPSPLNDAQSFGHTEKHLRAEALDTLKNILAKQRIFT